MRQPNCRRNRRWRGWYITATSDQVLYNNGDICANWSRPNGVRWSTGNTYESWDVVARDLGPERPPIETHFEKGGLMEHISQPEIDAVEGFVTLRHDQ